MESNLEDLVIRERELKTELVSITSKINLLTQQREVVNTEYEKVKRQIALIKLNSTITSPDFAIYSADKCFPWSEELDILRSRLFNIAQFRPQQLLAINAFLAKRDTILVMPTGAGKSLVYQLPAFLEKGAFAGTITLVISPLVSLITDQAISLSRLPINPRAIATLNANTTQTEQMRICREISDEVTKQSGQNQLRILFVTPEKLAKSKRLMHRLEKANSKQKLARIAIDEVHCVSQWGHDFRPDYKFLHVLRTQFPNVPILGLTATASAEVVLDVQKMLGIRQDSCLVLRTGYNRPNLRYEVIFQSGSLACSFPRIVLLVKSEFPGQSGIIYCLSQKDTEALTFELKQTGIRAAFYHASVDPDHRSRVHAAWLDNELQVIVATVAFGMGIDKPDVRFVLHASASKSVENYYQESGRAGRDGVASRVILFWRLADIFRLANLVFSEQTGLEKLMFMLSYALEMHDCRRRLLTRGLGDEASWQATDCIANCDNCSLTSTNIGDVKSDPSSFDLNKLLDCAANIISEQNFKSQRVTGIKLVDLLIRHSFIKQCLMPLTAPASPSHSLRTRFCEFFVAWCIVHRLIQMEFHFTPYSTIVYLAIKPRQALMPSRLSVPDWLFADNANSLKHPANQKGTKKRPAESPISIDSG